MRVFVGLRGPSRPARYAVVTMGVFDGVHVAHQQLIRRTVHLARRLQGTSVALTFDPDPQTVLDPAHAQPALMPLEIRVRNLQRLGVEWVWVLPFTKCFARLTPESFLRRILIGRLRTSVLVVGEAFAFGCGRRGDVELLGALGSTQGMRVVCVPPIRCAGAAVSSSRVRRLLAQGHLAQAARLLGRPPALYGRVVRGLGRGHRLGFPTANIALRACVVPPAGVYVVVVHDIVGARRWHGVMNIGVRPTFGPGPLVCEAHLVGFSGTLIKRFVTVSLLARLRAERCFPSSAALARQIRNDVARARRFFHRHRLTTRHNALL